MAKTQTAKELAEAENENGEGHNGADSIEAKNEAVRQLVKDLEPHEETVRTANTQMKKLRQTFKAETGITIADFNAARRLAQMEDEGERERKINNMKVCYNALSEGDQLDWIKAEQEGKHTAGKVN